MAGVGAYPGSFNPPTVAHLAIADAGRRHAGLDRVVLVVSRSALGKPQADGPSLEDRLDVLTSMTASRPWLGVDVTDAQLIADVAEGYDVVIAGADKWAQVVDPAWYGGSVAARDAAVKRLPRVLVVRRHPFVVTDVELLDIDPEHLMVSSTAARAGRRDWMAPEAAAFDAATGAWSDPARYARWRSSGPAPADSPDGPGGPGPDSPGGAQGPNSPHSLGGPDGLGGVGDREPGPCAR